MSFFFFISTLHETYVPTYLKEMNIKACSNFSEKSYYYLMNNSLLAEAPKNKRTLYDNDGEVDKENLIQFVKDTKKFSNLRDEEIALLAATK